MKPDLYTKIVLSIIAVSLMILILKDIQAIPTAQAGPNPGTANTQSNYALVPMNPDGSIDIHIKSIPQTERVDVNITDFPYESLNINLSDISTYSVLRVEQQ